MKTSIYVIRCLCGQTWTMDATTEHTCTCGVKLFRDGKKCCAEVPDGYDISKQPYHFPAIYKWKVQVTA